MSTPTVLFVVISEAYPVARVNLQQHPHPDQRRPPQAKELRTIFLYFMVPGTAFSCILVNPESNIAFFDCARSDDEAKLLVRYLIESQLAALAPLIHQIYPMNRNF